MKFKLWKTVMVLVGLTDISLYQSATACSVCGCGDPLQVAGDARPISGEILLGFEGEYLSKATAQNEEDSDRTESVIQSTLKISLAVSPGDRWKAVLTIPLVRKNAKAEGGADPTEQMRVTGLGDLELGVRYFLGEGTDMSKRRSWNVALTAGTSIPTGHNNVLIDDMRMDEHHQPGTGAWGPYVGCLYGVRGLRWTFMANLAERFRTENKFGYRYGSAFLWGAETQVKLVSTFALGVAVEGRAAVADKSLDEEVANTGGTVWNVTPTLWVNPKGETALYARFQIPVVRNMLGEQTLGPTLRVGLQFALR